MHQNAFLECRLVGGQFLAQFLSFRLSFSFGVLCSFSSSFYVQSLWQFLIRFLSDGSSSNPNNSRNRITQPHRKHKKDHRWLQTFDLFISNGPHSEPDSVKTSKCQSLTICQYTNLHAKKAIKLSTISLFTSGALLSLSSGQSLEASKSEDSQ